MSTDYKALYEAEKAKNYELEQVSKEMWRLYTEASKQLHQYDVQSKVDRVKQI